MKGGRRRWHAVDLAAPEQQPRLIENASKGEPFIIAKAGKPLVKVVALDAPMPGATKRTGFMAGQFTVPDDFDRMGEKVSKPCLEETCEAAP
ncbi:type II toxin-antitoxin system Phd/YefM family antitoxin [Hoeflea sp.]|uniref:type II toxin-antitoxin system Phd/YefM family antitoxin n=1 Tax=Hoeflea sp. TaxID=1940281 RepID=UPI003B01F3E4